MANLKEIRTRINSVASTRKVTSAMKMVSAAKLRRAQEAIVRIRPYADKLQEILSHLASSLDTNAENPFAQQREVKNILIIPITSNRGLCGAFNSNVVKKTKELLFGEYKEHYENNAVKIINIGKKSADGLKYQNIDILDNQLDIFDNLSFSSIRHLVEAIMEGFKAGQFDKVLVIYNQFVNAAVQKLKVDQFLPIQAEEEEVTEAFHADYIFEPTKEYILLDLIPKSLKIEFYKILLDSHAAEHGARMTAMHMATDNANELMKDLKLHYNKVRQADITKEILEIVSGAEALKG